MRNRPCFCILYYYCKYYWGNLCQGDILKTKRELSDIGDAGNNCKTSLIILRSLTSVLEPLTLSSLEDQSWLQNLGFAITPKRIGKYVVEKPPALQTSTFFKFFKIQQDRNVVYLLGTASRSRNTQHSKL